MNIYLNSISSFAYTQPSQIAEDVENASSLSAQPKQQRKNITSIALIAFGCLAIGYAIIQFSVRNFNAMTPGLSFFARLPPPVKTNLKVQEKLERILKNASDQHALPPHILDRPPANQLAMVAGLTRARSTAAPGLNRNLRSENVISEYSSSSPSLTLADLIPSQGFSLTDTSTEHTVNSAGDVNGDGLDDVIIGVSRADKYTNIAYVIFGGNAQPSAIDLTNLTPSQGFSIISSGNSIWNTNIYSANGAGDFNKDGLDDVIIGSPFEDISYVIYGSRVQLSAIHLANLTSNQGFPIIGNRDEYFGCSVSGAGDFNGDGLDDVIIGAPYANHQAGISYVIYGNETQPSAIHLTNLISSQGVSIIGNIPGSLSGWSVSRAGHFNPSQGILRKYNDVIIGAPYANNYAGISYVIFGSQLPSTYYLGNLTIKQGISIFGEEGISGWSVSGAGYFNGDRYDDVIIGAPYANFDSGVSYIVYGGYFDQNIYLATMFPDRGLYLLGTEGMSGSSVSSSGDVNGDHLGDVIIGAPYANNNAGVSYVIYGTSRKLGVINIQNLGTNGFSIIGKLESLSGWSVSGAGNMIDSAYDDIIIGSKSFKSYVIYGSNSGFVTPSPTALPTPSPTAPPTPETQNDDIWVAPRGDGFRAIYSVASFIVSIVAGYCFREKIALHILDHWGHKYKFLFGDKNTQLEEGEIGLRLDNGAVTCVVKGNSYQLHTDDNDAGISEGLYDLLKRVLESSDILESYTLNQHEQNQLRDFLIFHDYIKTKKICCGIKSYPELGHLKGTIYKMILSSFEEHHKTISKRNIRSGVSDSHISMQVHRYTDISIPATGINPVDADDESSSLILSDTLNRESSKHGSAIHPDILNPLLSNSDKNKD